jgi:hypothetical protein
MNRSYREVSVATVHQHGRTTLAVTHKAEISQAKDGESRDKKGVRTGKVTQAGQAA